MYACNISSCDIVWFDCRDLEECQKFVMEQRRLKTTTQAHIINTESGSKSIAHLAIAYWKCLTNQYLQLLLRRQSDWRQKPILSFLVCGAYDWQWKWSSGTSNSFHLAAKHYSEAIEKYTAAIEANPKVAVYYSNRSACYIKTEAYGYAIA